MSAQGAPEFSLSRLQTYLKTLPSFAADQLYSCPAACLATFRSFSPHARQIILRLLFIDEGVPVATIVNWFPGKLRECEVELTILKSLRVADIVKNYVIINVGFRSGFKDTLFGRQASSLGEVSVDVKHRKDIDELEKYAIQRWECLLYYLALSSSEMGAISSESTSVLQSAGFIDLNERSRDSKVSITSSGFQFLLTDTASQVWIYLLQYLSHLREQNAEIVHCLTFVFELSFCVVGKAYSTDGFSEELLDFLQHLREIGLIYQAKRKLGFFYPTPLVLTLLTSQSRGSSLANQGEGFIVIETNFRCYAYTDSALQIAIIALFCDMMYRFDGFAVGVLTRDSIRKALQRGITANQILEFLRTNAHEQMMQNNAIIPPTVSDQLKLWELERQRHTFANGALYSQFNSDAEFSAVRNYAHDLGVILWEHRDKRLLVVKEEGHEDVKKFCKRQKT